MALLAERALSRCPTGDEAALPGAAGLRVAVVGRPNVGKSTLINRYLGQERLVTHDLAGTTRDSISVPVTLEGREYVLVDTAGIRRRSRTTGMVEKFSVVKSLQAVEQSDVVIVLFDAREGVTEQDVALVTLVLERGRALTLAVNKWDGLPEGQRRRVRQDLERRLPFLDFAECHFISALHGSNIYDVLAGARRAAEAAARPLPTHRLNRILQEAVAVQPPPVVRRSRVKLSYAHQGGRCPPVIVIHGNQTERLPDSYRRYLIGVFRRAFRLVGTPIRLELRTADNPFAGRRNPLTPRQVRRRRRLVSNRTRRKR